MDAIAAQEIPSPNQQPPQKKSNFRKVFNISSWVILFALLPITVLILLSQDSVPGDLFYPVKRSLENVVLAAASVSPATRVAFRTDLTERRFTEATKLLVGKSDTAALSAFIKDIEETQQEVFTLSNKKEKQELAVKLIKKIDEYQNKLDKVEIQVTGVSSQPSEESQAPPTAPPLERRLPSPIPTSVPTPKDSAVISPSPSPLPTPTPRPIAVSPLLSPTSVPTQPTQVPSLSPTLVPIPVVLPPSGPPSHVGDAILDTQKRLKRIKDRLEEEGKEEREKPEGRKEKKNSQEKSHVKD